MMKFFFVVLYVFPSLCFCQPNRWQQHVNYNMIVDVNTVTNRFTGIQKLTYTNNSPDKLDRVFDVNKDYCRVCQGDLKFMGWVLESRIAKDDL